MDSQDTYKNIALAAPYVLAGLISSLVFNYLALQLMQHTTPDALGWPFRSGSFNGETISIHYIGITMNIVLWGIVFSMIIPVLKSLFFGNQMPSEY